MKKIVVATHNENKLKDYLHYFDALPFEIIPISHFSGHYPEETGTTFEENALIKARHSYEASQLPSFADDSGFCVHVLGGIPGVYAGRFATNDKGERDFLFAFSKLQAMIGNLDPATDFVVLIAYVDGKTEKLFKGTLHGYFDFSKKDIPGFGYTPIFVPKENNPNGLSLGQMGDTLRRQISARGKAVSQLIDFLQATK